MIQGIIAGVLIGIFQLAFFCLAMKMFIRRGKLRFFSGLYILLRYLIIGLLFVLMVKGFSFKAEAVAIGLFLFEILPFKVGVYTFARRLLKEAC